MPTPKMPESPEIEIPRDPPAGSWAAVARMMAADDDSGFDWDAWKERDL
jgi:hypothetical protein